MSTSADAAGLAILPGLVRYDEAYGAGEIRHAFRFTCRATNGYVYPASHRAGSTAGALPMGARLRLRTDVGGLDPALRVADPNVRKIFRAMQKYGLIVADNGSDMYVTGTFDTRWNNDVLNPAFATLTASDFEVIRLGWRLHTRFTEGFVSGYVNAMLAAWVGSLSLMAFADWILPFVYNIGFLGFQASVLVWMFLGGLVAGLSCTARSEPRRSTSYSLIWVPD